MPPKRPSPLEEEMLEATPPATGTLLGRTQQMAPAGFMAKKLGTDGPKHGGASAAEAVKPTTPNKMRTLITPQSPWCRSPLGVSSPSAGLGPFEPLSNTGSASSTPGALVAPAGYAASAQAVAPNYGSLFACTPEDAITPGANAASLHGIATLMEEAVETPRAKWPSKGGETLGQEDDQDEDDDESDDDDDDEDALQQVQALRSCDDLADIPRAPAGAAYPSKGSEGHATGTCKRCCFFPRGRCMNGYDCEFCHEDHEKRKRKNKKKNKKLPSSMGPQSFSSTRRMMPPLVSHQTLGAASMLLSNPCGHPGMAGRMQDPLRQPAPSIVPMVQAQQQHQPGYYLLPGQVGALAGSPASGHFALNGLHPQADLRGLCTMPANSGMCVFQQPQPHQPQLPQMTVLNSPQFFPNPQAVRQPMSNLGAPQSQVITLEPATSSAKDPVSSDLLPQLPGMGMGGGLGGMPGVGNLFPSDVPPPPAHMPRLQQIL